MCCTLINQIYDIDDNSSVTTCTCILINPMHPLPSNLLSIKFAKVIFILHIARTICLCDCNLENCAFLKCYCADVRWESMANRTFFMVIYVARKP